MEEGAPRVLREAPWGQRHGEAAAKDPRLPATTERAWDSETHMGSQGLGSMSRHQATGTGESRGPGLPPSGFIPSRASTGFWTPVEGSLETPAPQSSLLDTDGEGSREPRGGHRVREASQQDTEGTHTTQANLGVGDVTGRGGGGRWPSGSPSPVGPRPAPQTQLCSHPPCHQ